MSSTITTINGKKYQTPSTYSQTKAVLAGGAAAGMAILASQLPLEKIISIGAMAQNSDEDVVEIRKAVNSALDISGAKAHGVQILDLKSEKKDFTELIPDFKKDVKVKDYTLKKALLLDISPKLRKTKAGKLFISNLAEMLKAGENAAYLPASKICAVNLEKIGAAVFHEIGHSINSNQSKFWPLLQNLRLPGMAAPVIIALTGIIKRKKVEGEEPKNVVDKVTTFIKENCGKLATLAFVPIVAEELKASARGNKLAKQLLKPESYKKVVNHSRFGAASYILTALISGLGAYVGSKVRDIVADDPKLITSKPKLQTSNRPKY